MSYSKFRLKESGNIFYYQNTLNAIYNDKGECLSLEPQEGWEFFEEANSKNNFGVTHKTNKPAALRILFGHACNYSCGYCLQKDLGNPDERPQNIWLDTFISSLNSNLNLDDLERIELWGGEPFLYWNDIKPVMEYLDDPKRHFFISTNGSPLRQKHVDFFKTLKAQVCIGISHDGPSQEELRGEDIFNKEKVVESIRELAKCSNISFSFNTVITPSNLDMFKTNDYFKDVTERLGIKNALISYNPAKIYDPTDSVNSANHIIKGESLEVLKKNFNYYLKIYRDQLKYGGNRLLPTTIVYQDTGMLGYAKTVKHQIPITYHSNCGVESADILSIDIKGNIRLCPHTSDKYNAGHINELDKVRIIGLDLDRKDNHCTHCPVKRLCKSSCPIKFPSEVFLHNCRVEKIWHSAIQQNGFALLFGEEVELLETGIDEDRYKEDTRTSVTA